MKGRLLLVSTDKSLFHEMGPSAAGREFQLQQASAVLEAVESVSAEETLAVVCDMGRLTALDRPAIAQLPKARPGLALFLLETLSSLSPAEPLPLRRLPWPFPNGFADQVRAVERPIVFFVDQALFTTAAVQAKLQESGIQPLSVESTVGLIELIHKQAEAMTPKPKHGKSFWAKLGKQEPEEEAPSFGKTVIAFFPGPFPEAEELDARIRASVPGAVCYFVSGADTVRGAVKAVKESQPVALLREHAGRVAGILAESAAVEAAGPREKERILLLDNYLPTLTALGQSLAAAGYEVVATMDGGEALRLAGAKGSFQLAVIGTALAYAQQTGADLAQKLREVDPDLRIIFMVDRYPLQTALQGVSQVVELGLDDALLKPVEASRLIFSVQRALERRFLLLENARLLTEVRESNRQLAQINGFQKKFFAMVAHDVKNPLTAILGYAELLGPRLADRPTELRCAGHIHSAAKTLSTLISDLVDLAAIESGKLRVSIGALDLAAVVAEVRARIDVVAQQRKIEFSVKLPETLPELAGDPQRIGQVIQNLCTNAIQYTKEGGKVSVEVDVGPQWVTVGVRDTGIGIAKEDLPRVFERFFQSEQAQQMRKAGFGLGLKIAREIVQMHGGEMGVESALGVGSRFFFTLPVKK